MHELDDLRARLITGLSRALRQSAGGQLGEEPARKGAAMVLDGYGLPEEVGQIFGDRPVCSLLCFDADAIQGWVFASERIQVVGGASMTLEHLNRDAREILAEIPEVCGEIYSAGGGGMFLAQAVEDPKAQAALAEKARRGLEEKTPGMTFAVFAHPLKASDLAASEEPREIPANPDLVPALRRFHLVDGVRGALVQAQVRMAEIKSARPRVFPTPVLRPPSGGIAPRCGSCGRRPPGKVGRADLPENWCSWCQERRKYFRKHREDFEIDGRPLTFADLAESVDRKRQYLAFLAIDGNAMGSVVRSLGTFLELAAFSAATTRVYEQARTVAEDTLARFLAEGKAPESAQLSLLSGGDEITLVLPAAAGPRVACAVLREVERGFSEETAPEGLLGRALARNPVALGQLQQAGASAGLLLAGSTYPVRLMRHYANALQKQAKTISATGPRSAIAWALLTESSPLSEMLDRPGLPLAAFEGHLAEAEEAARKKVPLSALQAVLAQVRREGRTLEPLDEDDRPPVLAQLGANFFRYQLARNGRLQEWWEAIAGGLPSEPDTVHHWFREGQGQELDRLLDLLSIDPQETVQEVAP